MNALEIVNNKENMIQDEDDDIPKLSAETLKTLQEFYAESELIENKTEINENWQLSQFWYDKNTSETLSLEVLNLAVTSLKNGSESFKIGFISCPTLFKFVHNYIYNLKAHEKIKDFEKYTSKIYIKLFEYDKRFEIYGSNYIFYDYKNPLNLDSELNNFFDLIISDPPYLATECHIKTGMTIKKIGKVENLKLIICTGAIMEDLLESSLKVCLCKFKPKHERNLSNEFKCYANYNTIFLNE